jgi:ribosomal protein S18
MMNNEWEEKFKLVKQFSSKTGHLPDSDSPLGMWCRNQRKNKKRSDMPQGRIKLLESIKGWTWDVPENSWEENFLCLKNFVEQNGRMPVVGKDPIGKWANKQRYDGKKGTLRSDRYQALDSLPGWTWDLLELVWMETFNEIKEFAEKHGRVPYNREGSHGHWCGNQRKFHRAGKLPEDRIRLLESIPQWAWAEDLNQKWNGKFEEYSSLVNQGKKMNEPIMFWSIEQRKLYKKGSLAQDRIDKLESVPGWKWSVDPQSVWDENLEKVRTYIEENNALPKSTMPFIGAWCNNQRDSYKKGTLSEERIKRLETLPGWKWALLEDTWDESFEELKALVKEHGSIPIAKKSTIGNWCYKQRKHHRDGNLSRERVGLLDSVPGWYWGENYETKWKDNFEQFLKFVNENGGRFPEGPLSVWRENQRKVKKAGKLSQERIALLESIPGWAWESHRAWEDRLAELREYVEKHMEFPSQRDGSLGIWCNNQRTAKKRNGLSQDRAVLLETIPGWKWNVDQWDSNFQEFKKFVESNGQFPGDNALGVWYGVQRRSKEKLSQNRIALLEAIPGWTWEDEWQENLNALIRFVKENGRIPHGGEGRLGAWCSIQREKGVKKLSRGKVFALGRVSGWKW